MEKTAKLEALCEDLEIEYRTQAPLSDYTTFKIGGKAPIVAFPSCAEQVAAFVKTAREAGCRLFVLGRGSNMLFSDKGYDGAILCIGSRFSRIELVGEELISCQSGASLTQLCRFAQENGLSGLEFAFGIPGTVGGAIYMNAGAYGGEISDVLRRSEHICADGTHGGYEYNQLQLGYRHSVYMEQEAVITSGLFQLRKDDPQAIRQRMDEYMRRRREKQPLELPSAGSTFKRPAGAYASALIDQCGLKGRRVGGAQVSAKHAGFIVNTGGATCNDVLELVRQVQEEVRQKTGFQLECEVNIVDV